MRSRALLAATLLGLAACNCTPDATPHEDTMTAAIDWRGPAVHSRHLGDGGMSIELTAPTAGHGFRVRDVTLHERGADVVCEHTTPTSDFVAQVVTPHVVEVPAARLGDARAVWIRVATDGGEPQLALATARP